MIKINNRYVTRVIILVTYLFLESTPYSFSQERIETLIIDKETKLSIPFANVHLFQQSTVNRLTTNENGGIFIFNTNLDSIKITFPGYYSVVKKSSEIYASSLLIIELEQKIKEIGVALVSNKNNPALRIIKNVIKNNQFNDYLNYPQYHYTNYSKTIYDIKSDTLQSIVDSIDYGKKHYSNLKALMINESVIEVNKLKSNSSTKIIAQKTAGLKSNFISTLLANVLQHQISFYPNLMSIIQLPIINNQSNIKYLSPVCNEALTGYNYFLQETIFQKEDTLYIIEFNPKKDANFNGLKGILQINSHGFAIESIVVEPKLESTVSFKLKQDYQLIENKWFPSELSGEIYFKDFSYGKNAFPILKVYSKNSTIAFTDESITKVIQFQKTQIDEQLILKSDSILMKYRPKSLTKREFNTYKIVDSIGELKRSDFWISLAPKLMNGKMPILMVDLDLKNLYSKNIFEKYRFGVSLITNEKFSKEIVLGGFVNYGVRDDRFKYGTNISYVLNENRYLFLTYSFQNNIKEIGVPLKNSTLMPSVNDYFRNFTAQNFDQCIENKIELSGKLIRYSTFSAALSLQKVNPMSSLSLSKSFLEPYTLNEVQVGLNYNYKEELMTIGNQRRVNYVGNPQIKFNYFRGVSFNQASDILYNKLETSINYVFYKGRLGQTNFKLCAGYIDRPSPIGLMFSADGVNSNINKWIILDYFQTMGVNEFISSEYVNLFFRHNFGDLLFQYRKFNPQINLVHNTGWGDVKNTNDLAFKFKKKNNVYVESGLILNNLLKMKIVNIAYAGFGVGVFYRYGYYANPELKDNITVKVSYLLTLR